MNEIIIKMYSHDDEKLWCRIGRYFADRAIRRDLGAPMSSDDRYRWWIAEKDAKVAGFAATASGKGVVTFHHSYVFKPHRGNGIYTALLNARIRFAKSSDADHITAICTHASRLRLEKAGFREIGTRGQYSSMRYDL